MKKHFLLFILAVLQQFCTTSQDSEISIHTNDYLETGCYAVTQTPTKYSRITRGSSDVIYLQPVPLVNLNQIVDVQMSNRDGFSLYIYFNKRGEEAFTEATEKYTGKRLAIVVDNEVIIAPKIAGKITGESVQIAGGFTEDEMFELYKKIKEEIKKN
ncbi:hypothetical protein CNR22_13120 [Sphingobacteriaceae bacterium]|nr:hypothetical protein CNR22_13120 [Sphingobacteriaceae bacterium]